MSSITLSTRDFVGLLADVSLTSGADNEFFPLYATVLLDCAHGEIQIESKDDDDTEPMIGVVPSDLLVGMSTDGTACLSQAHVACSGMLHRPVLISVDAAKSLVQVFTAVAKAAAKTMVHQTKVEIQGPMLQVQEDPIQVPGGVTVTIPLVPDIEDYPVKVWDLLTPDEHPEVKDRDTGSVVDPSFGTGLGQGAFEIIGKVAKRRKMTPRMYRAHQDRPVVVEIGSLWRGAFLTSPLEKHELVGPEVDIYRPQIPEKPKKAHQPDLSVVSP